MVEINGVSVKNGTTERELKSILGFWCAKCPKTSKRRVKEVI